MKSLLALIQRLRRRVWDPDALQMAYIEEVPEDVGGRHVYLVGDPSEPWCAVMLCPCGCGARIDLSLVKYDSPHWRAQTHWNRSVTLHPSVWRVRGCRSHFFVRRGRIVWAGVTR